MLRRVDTHTRTVSELLTWARSIAAGAQVVGAILVIVKLNPVLAVVALGLTPLFSRAIRSIVVRTARLAHRQQTAAADALKFADERLSQASSLQQLHTAKDVL